MKRLIRNFPVLVCLLILGVVSSCSKNRLKEEVPLIVGNWQISETAYKLFKNQVVVTEYTESVSGWKLSFLSDGSGQWEEVYDDNKDVFPLSWVIDDDTLTLSVMESHEGPFTMSFDIDELSQESMILSTAISLDEAGVTYTEVQTKTFRRM